MDYTKANVDYRKLKKYIWVHNKDFPLDTPMGHKDSHGVFYRKKIMKIVRWDNCAPGEDWSNPTFIEFVALTAPKNSENWNTKTAIARHFIKLTKI